MAPSLDFTVALICVAPFLAAFMAPSIKRFTGHYAGWILAIVPASIFVYLLGFIETIADKGVVRTHLSWVPAYNLDFSFFIDGLSLTFALLISGIGTLIVIYSGSYLRGHGHQGRFFAYILMFMGSMLGLVLADNLIAMFVFWELTSMTSFVLIGFDHHRQAARRAAIQAIVVTNAGGLALLIGIILLHGVMGEWEISALREVGAQLHGNALYPLIMALFCLGAFTKSAQFPFHFWLPNAMEAPTPVSAFLHSATMVKAGVYLLARMTPVLGDTPLWQVTLMLFGGVTLLYGATLALRQTDLKQMLAQTTVASLGLLVLLIGVGTEGAIAGAVVYLLAHALYKAGLFLVAGLIDHGAGTREITELGGLRRYLPVTFVAAALGGLSMAGLPPTIGFLAKEEMYGAVTSLDLSNLVVLLVLILGNALMFAVGAAIAITPFFGGLKPTPVQPHEGPFPMWVAPGLLGIVAIAAGALPEILGHVFLAPTASTIYNHRIESHLHLDLSTFLNPIILLSLATWALGVVVFWRLTDIRKALHRFETWTGWNFDTVFDRLMFGLIRMSDGVTRLWHHGRLEFYLIVVFVCLAAAIYVPLIAAGALPSFPKTVSLTFYEWGILLVAVLGLVAVILARTRLVAIVSLGIQGFAVALIFMLFGAPDLSFTQFMVETLSVVILTLVMTRLHLDRRDSRILEEVLRDGALAVICGVGVTLMLVSVLQYPLDTRLTDFFAQTSLPIAHGHNIVNVILVDYRGLDTLGEISVVMTAGIAILALIRIRAGGPQTGIGALPNRIVAHRRRKGKQA